MKTKFIEIGIRILPNGFRLLTPYSTTFCESISQLCDDIEMFMSDYIQVYGGEKNVESEA